VKDGNLYVANLGDCRAVMSRDGTATALTSDHTAARGDERVRIESSVS
jgi:protein phosphatase 1L